jgi:hypothetical protein
MVREGNAGSRGVLRVVEIEHTTQHSANENNDCNDKEHQVVV